MFGNGKEIKRIDNLSLNSGIPISIYVSVYHFLNKTIFIMEKIALLFGIKLLILFVYIFCLKAFLKNKVIVWLKVCEE